jgi:hypothetical protein
MATGTNMAPFILSHDREDQLGYHLGYEQIHKRDRTYKPKWLNINSRNWHKVHSGSIALINIPMNGLVLAKLVQVGSSRRERIVFAPVDSDGLFFTDGWNLFAIRRADLQTRV